MNWFINLLQSIVFQTVISGVLVFVISQIISKFFLEPIQKYKAIIGKIDNKLKFYANIITSPGITSEMAQPQKDKYLECSKVLRDLSCELEENYKQIPFVRIVKLREEISEVAHCLIGLSNGIFNFEDRRNNDDLIKRVRENLNIPKL
ncbi:MAG: hypothetical protein UT42_C0039G0006 [Candidatus Falkowbacteria bacterium GW2011_GWA2_39_24]|uniref:Uncharacterized protein n=1 Tax=Candidatus Falkowbacteria bacterium GW2011_GWA2_39_24 TaxID=1618634 RepID=A0A0G0NLT2_9BACT|nr:MAG: hypothetical protein UT42_C0039G0006 [Candidatus Falkowbacteria bacterium GW2011_GWA2_39_24]